jgi:hypothetical protein
MISAVARRQKSEGRTKTAATDAVSRKGAKAKSQSFQALAIRGSAAPREISSDPPIPNPYPLTAVERNTLRHLERAVEKHAASVFEFGRALREIRDQRLYRDSHASFEAYLSDRWGISRADGYRQIQAATVAEIAQPIGDKLGFRLTNESQCRPLSKVEPTDLPAVLKRAARIAGKSEDGSRKLTAEVLTRAVREELTPPAELAEERRQWAEGRGQKGKGLGIGDSGLDRSVAHGPSAPLPLDSGLMIWNGTNLRTIIASVVSIRSDDTWRFNVAAHLRTIAQEIVQEARS